MNDYIQINDICKTFNKKPAHFKEYLKESKKADLYSSKIGIPISDLIVTKKGGKYGGSTFVHKSLSGCFYMWAVPDSQKDDFILNFINLRIEYETKYLLKNPNEIICKEETPLDILLQKINKQNKEIEKKNKEIEKIKNIFKLGYNKTIEEIFNNFGKKIKNKMLKDNFVVKLEERCNKKKVCDYKYYLTSSATDNYFNCVKDVYYSNEKFINYLIDNYDN